MTEAEPLDLAALVHLTPVQALQALQDRSDDSATADVDVRVLGGTVYASDYEQGFSLQLVPAHGAPPPPRHITAWDELQLKDLKLDAVDIYGERKAQTAGRSKQSQFSPYSRAMLRPRKDLNEDQTAARSNVTLETTGRQLVNSLGEPSRKGGGSRVPVWLEWANQGHCCGIHIELNATGPQAWDEGADATWACITVFRENISALSIAISYLSTYMYQCANVSLWPSTSFGLLDTSNDEYGATKGNSRSDVVQNLIDTVDRYNPSNTPILEEYLQEQLSSGTYDAQANLALIKLFQFNPSILSPSSVLSVLLLALIHAPFEPDFSLSWALLGDSFVVGAPLPPAMGSDDEDDEVEKEPVLPEEERIAAEKLRDLSELIQAHKLREFWTVFDKLANDEKLAYLIKGLLESATNATAILRRHIATQIGITFRSVSRSTLSKFLGLEPSAPALDEIVQTMGWSAEGETISIPANDSNAPKPAVIKENLEMGQMSRLLRAVG